MLGQSASSFLKATVSAPIASACMTRRTSLDEICHGTEKNEAECWSDQTVDTSHERILDPSGSVS